MLLNKPDEIKRNKIVHKKLVKLLNKLEEENLLEKTDNMNNIITYDEDDKFSMESTLFLINCLVESIDPKSRVIMLDKLKK